MIVREVHDLVRVWAYAASLIHKRISLGGPDPCEYGCLFCDTCGEAYRWIASLLEDSVTYSVQDSGREVGFVYVIGSTPYSFMYNT
jgi:hypothetical protein